MGIWPHNPSPESWGRGNGRERSSAMGITSRGREEGEEWVVVVGREMLVEMEEEERV